MEADITEVFSSIQGEGIFAGAKQVFVRFAACNMKCHFCDEADKAGSKVYSAGSLAAEVRSLEKAKGKHHSVSLTGGEPLLYASFLKEFIPLLKKDGHKIYLETNGTLPGALGEVIDLVDIIAMDFKLPSATREKPFWDAHREFLKIAAKRKVFVKAVVTHETKGEDLEKAAELIKSAGVEVPLIIQPATPVRKADAAVKADRLVGFLETVTSKGVVNARIVPQIHKMLGMP
ncbi:MAG: 7-carboxy-7-deazaguanine synthase QueE [Candidatus Omnitrophica bacterium]|nr:7-carboxy-7-deazaguanine synthase QueE [Candidatus Omnitrophota bacterium]